METEFAGEIRQQAAIQETEQAKAAVVDEIEKLQQESSKSKNIARVLFIVAVVLFIVAGNTGLPTVGVAGFLCIVGGVVKKYMAKDLQMQAVIKYEKTEALNSTDKPQGPKIIK